MQTVTIPQPPLSRLKTLVQPDSKQYLEWSIKINHYEVEHRHKPTLYIYRDEAAGGYHGLCSLLEELDCPADVVQFHRRSGIRCRYQGLRIPDHCTTDKCLFIHREGYAHIDSFRWKDRHHYDSVRYMYCKGAVSEDIRAVIHPSFQPLLERISKSPAYAKQYGTWLQEYNGVVSEIYVTFPERMRLNWLIDVLRDDVSPMVADSLLNLRDLKFKNMGFESYAKENPEFTIYFTLPIRETFPEDYDDTVAMTREFFSATG